MGATGGSIANRADMIHQSNKKEKMLQEVERESTYSKSFWTTCTLTGEDLEAPIVVTKSGQLINKLPLVEAMLTKNLPSHLKDIKSLKLVKDLDLRGKKTPTTYVCPLSSVSPYYGVGGSFLFLWECGHMFEESKFRSFAPTECPICSMKINDKKIIKLCSREIKDPLNQ